MHTSCLGLILGNNFGRSLTHGRPRRSKYCIWHKRLFACICFTIRTFSSSCSPLPEQRRVVTRADIQRRVDMVINRDGVQRCPHCHPWRETICRFIDSRGAAYPSRNQTSACSFYRTSIITCTAPPGTRQYFIGGPAHAYCLDYPLFLSQSFGVTIEITVAHYSDCYFSSRRRFTTRVHHGSHLSFPPPEQEKSQPC
ncbi:hypothetical protein B0H17DRAFT_61231 [Mycena rosella]|uniref:Uncharacterized protein n=1 Tax=Mycena rosella TaxID=1033263 RepID=A0AAD7G9P8_MYCRO|nr:hypothetical protein B0H17DRAFT_61231 [Mycena rosella]